MEIIGDNLLRSEFLYVAALYASAREPAVLLLDLNEEEGRRVWDDVLGEPFEGAAPWQEPSDMLVLDGPAECRWGGLATGRIRMMRILRDRLGESDASKMLVVPPPHGYFHMLVIAGGNLTFFTAPTPALRSS